MLEKFFQLEENNIPFLQFPLLEKQKRVFHAVFTRKGGVSSKPFDFLNVGLNVGDKPECVEKNRYLISQCFNGAELIFINQVHGNKVLVFKKNKSRNMTGDAVITNIPQKALVIQTADCQSVILYDTIENVVGNVHSGWHGSIQNIVGLTIEAMQKEFGTNPENIIAGISPCLGLCCAEFINYKKEIPKIFWKYKNKNNHFDFLKITTDQLADCGVLKKNIDISEICTSCRTNTFFSYRREKTTGRFASIVGLVS